MKKALILLLLPLLLGAAHKPDGARLEDLKVAPDSRLGLAFPGDDPSNYPKIAEAGIGIVRLDATQSLREPSAGQYAWGGLDARIHALNALGIEVFLTFVSDAYGEPTTSLAKNKVPLDMDQWWHFVFATVERYDFDGVDDCSTLLRATRYYQTGNEWTGPNNQNGGWAGTPQQFVVFNNTTFDAVKQASPESFYVFGGIPTDALQMLVHRRAPEVLLQTVRECRLDMLDGHFYGPTSLMPPKLLVLAELRSVPIISAECGGPNLAFTKYSETEHFMSVLSLNLEAQAQGIPFILWFRLFEGSGATANNTRVPLFDAQGRTKPGYWAYFLTAALLKDAIAVSGGNPYVIAYEDGSSRTVAWGSGTIETTEPVLRVTDAKQGLYQYESPGKITLGPLPVVIGKALR